MNIQGLVVFSIAVMVAAVPAQAGQVLRKVWFPDGEITWRGVDLPADMAQGVQDATDYLAQRTPLTLTERPLDGELEIRWTRGLFDGSYGGMTKGYRNENKANKLMRLSSHLGSAAAVRDTVLHEMGHVLGFTHEFQRPDRGENGITICGNCQLDPFNFDVVGSGKAMILTPYDFFSRFATGYAGVTPNPVAPQRSRLSQHDIGAIWRVYGRPFGDVAASDRFGSAVTAGDYDGDDIEDIAVASVEGTGSNRNVILNLFKGVETDSAEEGTGAAYVPWFRELVAVLPERDLRVVLVSGELKESDGATRVRAGRDGIDEIVVGLPGADGGDGEVRILTINVIGRFGPNDIPWGGIGVHHETLIRPTNFGLTDNGGQEFGAALLLADLSNGDVPDLVVGAPGTIVSAGGGVARNAGAVVYLPQGITGLTRVWKNPSGRMQSRFGAALAMVPDFYEIETNSVTGGTIDALVVGAPGEDTSRIGGAAPTYFDAGAVYVYGPAVDDAGDALVPVQRDRIASFTDGQLFGSALAGFLTNKTENVWSPQFHLLVGGPEYATKTFKGGKISLYELDPEAESGVTFLGSATMPGNQERAGFGTALALFADSCGFGECSRGDIWVAVGAPRAKLSGDEVGIVYRWDPWNVRGELAGKGAVKLANGSHGSEYGSALAALKPLDPEGGFIIGGPGARVQVELEQVDGGVVDLRFQQSFGDTWSDLHKRLTKMTAGDKRPENL